MGFVAFYGFRVLPSFFTDWRARRCQEVAGLAFREQLMSLLIFDLWVLSLSTDSG